jgi:hypothetical protein
MSDDAQRQVATLLDEMRAGQPGARDRLAGLVHDELRRLAGGLLWRERAGHRLEPTALVHEAVVRLLHPNALANAQTRAHFFGAAGRESMSPSAALRARLGLPRLTPLPRPPTKPGYENFELQAPFREGQEFWFGLTPEGPPALGFDPDWQKHLTDGR